MVVFQQAYFSCIELSVLEKLSMENVVPKEDTLVRDLQKLVENLQVQFMRCGSS